MFMPMVLYALLYGSFLLIGYFKGAPLKFDLMFLQLISPVINLFFIRYYFVSKKYDDSGRGVLLVTFVYIISFFIIN